MMHGPIKIRLRNTVLIFFVTKHTGTGTHYSNTLVGPLRIAERQFRASMYSNNFTSRVGLCV